MGDKNISKNHIFLLPGSEGFASPLTTKGDIIVHDGSEEIRLGVGSDGQVLTADSLASGGVSWITLGGGAGEANTAANIGTAGVGLFVAKVGVELRFKNINSGSSKITITDDTGNNEVDVDVNESNLDINAIGGTPLDVANGGTGATTHGSGNVLVGAGTGAVTSAKAAPSGAFVGTTDTQTLSNKSLIDNSTSIVDGTNNTISIQFDAAGSTSTSTTLRSAQTSNIVLTLPDQTDTIIARTTTDTLTNKTITSSTNNVTANGLRSATTTVSVSSAAAPSSGQVLTATSSSTATWQTPSAEANTASNIGAGGVGVFDGKVGVDLQFKNIAAGSSKITVTDDTVNDEIDIDVSESNLDKNAIGGSALTVANGGTGATTHGSGNVLVGAGTSAITSTKAAPTGAFVGTTDTQTLTNKTLTSPVLTTPRINDTSADHQYIFAVNELTANRTVTLPLLTGNDTFVFEAHTQTLSNKTLTLPQINDTSSDHQYIFAVSELLADRTVTLPLLTGNDTFVFEAHTQTLSNKTLSSPTVSGNVVFDEATNDLTLAITDQASGTATATVPDLGGVSQDFVFTSQTQTLTNKTLTSPVLTTPQVNDTSSDHQYIFGVSELLADRTVTLPLLTGNDTFVFESHTQTLNNKTLSSPTVSGNVVFDEATNDLTLAVTDQATGTATATVPDLGGVSQDFVFTTQTQTLTNKTLTSPVLTTPQINDTSADHQYIFGVSELAADRTVTLPLLTGNDTFVFEAHTQTLTNKTISSSTNTVGANELRTSGASVVIDAASPPSTGDVLRATSATTATWQAPNERVSYVLFSHNVNAAQDTYVTAAYFPWNNSRFSGYTSGTVSFEAVISNRELTVRLYDNAGAASLGSVTTTGSGFYTFSVTNPSGNSRLELQILKSATGGTNPSMYGALLEYVQ